MRWLSLLVVVTLLAGCSGGSGEAVGKQGAVVDSLPAGAPISKATSDFVAATPGSCFGRGPGDYIDSVEREEGARSFRIHVPPSYDGRALVPVLFNFHGQARTAEQQDAYSGMIPLSDEKGFILVSPEGGDYPQQWNIVGLYAEDGIDDVGAVSAMVDSVESSFCVDTGRVFATGISNGGQMAAQLGCYLPNQFAGVAPVAGIVFQGCDGPPVAVITFHGTDDYNVPYDTAPEAVAEWAKYNGCPSEPETERVGSQVVLESYFGCDGAPVLFYTLEGGGHTWPGAPDDLGGVGPTNHEINASELIWDLFGRIRRAQ